MAPEGGACVAAVKKLRQTGFFARNDRILIYNTGSEDHFLRRLVSVFLGPLASAYMFVVALLLGAALWGRVRLLAALSVCR